MKLDEAKKILDRAGYLLEFRDSSNLLDKETEESNFRNSDDKVSWNNVKARDRTNLKGDDTTKQANAVAKMTNSLISKVDEVCNRFEDYDYFVKRYDSNTIQIRTTEKKDTGVPFIQISVYDERDGGYKFCCGLGRVEQELRRKTYKEYTEVEDVLKWVSTCLGNGYINESLEDENDVLTEKLATFDGVVKEIKRLLKSKYEITDRSKFNQYVEELTPVRVPQVYTSAEYASKLCKNYFGW